MAETYFNVNRGMTTPPRPPVSQQVPQKKGVNYWRMVYILFIILVVVVGGFFLWQKYKPQAVFTGYQAVFLDNGQVYFGNIQNMKNNFIDLKNIYYIQSPSTQVNQTAPTGSSISLVKLGSELHGPTDEMFIPMTHVLFYENLRSDSKVVQSMGTQTK
jgi:hypothetical protein